MKHTNSILIIILSALAWTSPAWAQWEVRESVLSEHTWYKIGVTEDGVYAIDYATLQSLGVDVDHVNPSQIRLFGNMPGMLPEENSKARFEDLSEIPVQVIGEDDGKFDEQDKVLFYGNGPVNLAINSFGYYTYEPNLYTDTVFYFLCLDSGVQGLRIQDNETMSVEGSQLVLRSYLDCLYHESEELSPYASGRIWYGDLVTTQEGGIDFFYEIPGLDNSKVIRMESKTLGRCKVPFTSRLLVNGNRIDQYIFRKYGDHEYGEEHKVVRSFYSNTDSLTIRYEIDSSNSNPMLFNDFFILSFWRDLQFRGGQMPFGIVSSQILENVTKVQVDSVGSEVDCWEISDPVYPRRQPMKLQSGSAFFGLERGDSRRFYLFEPSRAKAVASCQPIPNQNLHGVENADFLIITPRVFWEQSEALAGFHREQDSMNCVVVDVQEIFNEFSTGALDPTAIRDFIRMVYFRSDKNLKYVLFMGKGSHDYRNIKGMGNNFVPTYEIADDAQLEVNSMCSDDYFALMDQNEGKNCSGKVDIGMGRIPITTPEQGDAVLAKIKHYSDLSATHGIWKNNHLFMADNDSKNYVEHIEKLDYILDTSWRIAMTKKLYLDSYRIIKTPSGDRIPEANAKLVDFLEKGVGVFSYTGHGGTKSLSSEWVLSISDILALDNYDRLPFIHTATCEFSKFDNPNMVSGGELLLLNDHGGAIALLTTMRPTLAPYNLELSKSLHDHLYEKPDHQPLRFGDIYRIAKSDSKYYKKNNMVYVLFGDPALRFSYPSQLIQTEKVNGALVAEGAVGTVDTCVGYFEGYVEGLDEDVDTLFNGVVDIRIYDVKSKYTTLGNYGNPVEYYCYNDVIFEGKANVKEGRFSFHFPVPANINHGSGMARVSYYAYDSIRKLDANGVFDRLAFDIPDTLEVVDDKGPEIKLYWNDPGFVSGDVVRRRGVLYADLFDENGIYHYNVSIGRDIVLKTNLSGYDNMILNDWYEPAMDDYHRGRIALPVRDLEDGFYEFKLKAWDTQNNSSEVEIAFEVRKGAILAQVRNYPNPFTDETWFTFDHGDMTDRLAVVIDVFDVMGRQVAKIEQVTNAEVGVVTPIRWDGSALQSGVYVYRITVTDSEGKTRTMSQRMLKQ